MLAFSAAGNIHSMPQVDQAMPAASPAAATNHLSAAGGGQLSTKTGHFPLHQQKLQGFVVGFSGSKVFCLHQVSMQTLDMPQSASMHRYLGNLEWDKAYQASPDLKALAVQS